MMVIKCHETTVSNLPEEGFVRLAQILRVIPIGRSSWLAGVKAGRFPQPVKLGPRTSAWRVADIRAFTDTGCRSGNSL